MRSGADQSSSLTASLVSSPAGTSVVCSGPGLPSSLPAVHVPKAAAPQSYAYDDNKTYAVLDSCSNGFTAAAAAVEHCQTGTLPCLQTTNDEARLVT